MPKTNADKALVIGDDTRSFLTITRSLGRQGVEVHAAPLNFRAPALKSKYITAVHKLPYYLHGGDSWVQAITGLQSREKYSLIIPTDDRSVLPFHWRREELSPLMNVAIPGALAVETLFDKISTRDIAERCDVPIAEGATISGRESAAHLIDEYGAPLALKPRRSYYPDKLYARTNVIIADSEESLAHELARIEPEKYFVEKYFSGIGVGVSVLASSGAILQAFQHKRVHEPPQGGGSSYRKSAALDPDLYGACARIMEALDYTGLAMFEFKKNDDTDGWILIEVNARPWGSIPLAQSVGVDFPYRLYRLLVEGEETAHHAYPVNRYCRNWIQDYHCLTHWAGSMRTKPLRLAGLLAVSAAEFGRVLTGREKSDTMTPDDLQPGLVELKEFIKSKASRMDLRASRRLTDARTQTRSLVAELGRRSSPPTIGFVCLGNICRSPFAERYLVARMAAHGANARIVSAGVLPMPGRPSPEGALRAAAGFGVDLSDHRSKLFEDVADACDLIVVFDSRTLNAVLDRAPPAELPIVTLGDIGPRGAEDRAIDDPYGEDDAIFEATYRKIAEDIDGMLSLLSAGQGVDA
ncbi:MAG: hypothetical protein Tsb0010_02430 [Parvularculaceae bacterium]